MWTEYGPDGEMALEYAIVKLRRTVGRDVAMSANLVEFVLRCDADTVRGDWKAEEKMVMHAVALLVPSNAGRCTVFF